MEDPARLSGNHQHFFFLIELEYDRFVLFNISNFLSLIFINFWRDFIVFFYLGLAYRR